MLADGGIDTLPLHTNNGLIGYRITKFQLIAHAPGATDYRFVVQIHKVKPDAASQLIDFSDNRLLGAGEIEDNAAAHYPNSSTMIIFDNEKFNQDIYVSMSDVGAGESCNYYIELEQVKLDLSEQTVATLKDIRNVGTS